jgi:hypothetical protein
MKKQNWKCGVPGSPFTDGINVFADKFDIDTLGVLYFYLDGEIVLALAPGTWGWVRPWGDDKI